MYLTIIVNFILILQTCETERIITTLKYSLHRVKPVIVNGDPVSSGAVPYIVSIKKPKIISFTSIFRNFCGGSIITTRKVLTAAHCFESNNFRLAKDPSPLVVAAGDLRNDVNVHDITSNEKTQWRKISGIAIHPYYIFPTDDIALVFVSTNWEFSNWISPIKYAKLEIDYPPDTCYASGYGRIGFGEQSKRSQVLLRAKIEVMPNKRCTEIWEVPMADFICTSSVNADVAEGDSGGPLACRNTSDPQEEPGKELLVGVTSGKNFDLTSIFTRVSAYTDWIDAEYHAYKQGCDLQNWSLFFYLILCLIII